MDRTKTAIRFSGILLTICLAFGGAFALIGTGLASPTGKVETALAAAPKNKKQAEAYALNGAAKRFSSEKVQGINVKVNKKMTKGKYGAKLTWHNYSKTSSAQYYVSGKKMSKVSKTLVAKSYTVTITNSKGKIVFVTCTTRPWANINLPAKGTYTVKVVAKDAYSKGNTSKPGSTKIKV